MKLLNKRKIREEIEIKDLREKFDDDTNMQVNKMLPSE